MELESGIEFTPFFVTCLIFRRLSNVLESKVMFKIVIRFSLAFLFTSQVFAAVNLQCENLFNNYLEQLTTDWDILDNMPEGTKDSLIKKQAMQVKRDTMALWSQLGIKYEQDPNDQFNLLVSIPADAEKAAHSHAFNRMAYSMSKNLRVKSDQPQAKLLRVGVNPYLLKVDNAGALFDEQGPLLTLARDNVITGQIDDMVTHENRHAYNFYSFANGNDHVFTAWFTTANRLPIIHETYPHTFSADEFTAFVKQINLQIRLGIRTPAELSDALDFTQIALTLAHTATNPKLLETSALLVANLNSHPEKWQTPRAVKLRVDEKKVDALMYTSHISKSVIYIYEAPMLEDKVANGKLKSTHVFIHNGDYKLDMQTLVPFNPASPAPVLTQVENKIRGLQYRIVEIQKSLLMTEAALKASDAPAALLALSGAMAQIGLEESAVPRK